MTIYDKDFLIYTISQVMERVNRGERAPRRLILYASNMLEFGNRAKGGKDYKTIEDAPPRKMPDRALACAARRSFASAGSRRTNASALRKHSNFFG